MRNYIVQLHFKVLRKSYKHWQSLDNETTQGLEPEYQFLIEVSRFDT